MPGGLLGGGAGEEGEDKGVPPRLHVRSSEQC